MIPRTAKEVFLPLNSLIFDRIMKRISVEDYQTEQTIMMHIANTVLDEDEYDELISLMQLAASEKFEREFFKKLYREGIINVNDKIRGQIIALSNEGWTAEQITAYLNKNSGYTFTVETINLILFGRGMG